jgi:putative transposase
MDGRFLCEATLMPHLHPAAAHEGTKEEQFAVTCQVRLKRSQEKQTFGAAQRLLKEEILPETVRRLEASGLTKKEGRINGVPVNAFVDIDTPPSAEEIEQATREFNELMAAPPIEPSRRAEEAPILVRKEFTVDWQSLPSMPGMDRYELLLECEAREMRTPMSEKRWAAMYEKTEEYERFKNYFEDTALKFRLIHSNELGRGSHTVVDVKKKDSPDAT